MEVGTGLGSIEGALEVWCDWRWGWGSGGTPKARRRSQTGSLLRWVQFEGYTESITPKARRRSIYRMGLDQSDAARRRAFIYQ